MEDYKGSHVLLFDLNDSQASSSSSSFSVGRASLCSDQEDGSKGKSHMDKSKWKDHQAKEDHPQLQVDDRDHEDEAYKWMPSKMRILRKMMMSSCQESSQKFEDQKQFPSTTTVNHPNPSRRAGYKDLISDSVRVCADCNTTKTPLWRSGPRGPKSLCNACGIRQRKARRAMAAAAAAANGTILAVSTPPPLKIKLKHKKKRSKGLLLRDDKKTRKASSSPKSSLAPSKKDELVGFDFEDFTSKVLSKHYYAKVFPQDEKEAAILLMALSCGIVCN